MLLLIANPLKYFPESIQPFDSTSVPLIQVTSTAYFVLICPTTSATTASVIITTAVGTAVLSTFVISVLAAISFLLLLYISYSRSLWSAR